MPLKISNFLIGFSLLLIFCSSSFAESISTEIGKMAPQEFNADLSFDGFTIFIPELELNTVIPKNCDELHLRLVEYEQFEKININNVKLYIQKIVAVVRNWRDLLEPVKNKDVRVAKGVFAPLSNMDENLATAVSNMKNNGRILNDFMFNLLDFADLTCNKDNDFLDALEVYANEVFSTNNEFAIFVESTNQDFQTLADKLLSYEKLPSAKILSSQVKFFATLSSDKLGSSGFPEMLEVYSKYFELYFQKKLKNLKSLLPDGQPIP